MKSLEVHDYKVASFLSNRGRSRHLDPFLGQECSVAEAASLLGISAQRMHYWTRQLLDLGLISLVRTELHGRNRTSIYRSVADSFRVPLELLPTSDVETLELHFEPVWRRFLHSVAVAARKHAPGWHVLYSRLGGQAAFQIMPLEGTQQKDLQFTNSWARLRLTREQAGDLKRELEEVLARYLEQTTGTADRNYLAHIAVVQEAGSD